MYLQNKKLLLLIIIFGIILFILIMSLLLSKWIKTETSSVAPTPTYTYPTDNIQDGTASDDPIGGSTGARGDDLSEKERLEIHTEYELRNEVPVKTDAFTLDYNYDEWYFVVILRQPYTENKLLFIKWLQVNGYDQISEEEFVFIED